MTSKKIVNQISKEIHAKEYALEKLEEYRIMWVKSKFYKLMPLSEFIEGIERLQNDYFKNN